MNRAKARIDTGVATLSNQWIERRWSTFSGATIELYLTGALGDCLTRKSPEFHIDCGDQALAVSDVTDYSWSEAIDAHGASLTLEMRSERLYLTLENFMAHQCPGMVRHLQIFNTSTEAVAITRAATEILPLDPDVFSPGGHVEETAWKPADNSCPNYYHAQVTAPSGTLLMEAQDPEGFALFAPNPRYCATVWSGYAEIAPGKGWTVPPAVLSWQPGVYEPHRSMEALRQIQDCWRAHSDCPVRPDENVINPNGRTARDTIY